MRLASEERVTSLDPIFGRMGIEAGRHIWSFPHLTPREKTFLCLVADVCHPHLGLPFELHIGMGTKQGLTKEDFRALLRHLGPYAGYTACAVAFERFLEIAENLRMPQPITPERDEGEAALAPSYPISVLEHLGRLDVPLAEYVAQQAHRVWGRGGLSRRERAIVWLAVDVLNQTLDESFRANVELTLQSGASREDLRAVVRFLAEFGLPKAWRALGALNRHIGESLGANELHGPITGEVAVIELPGQAHRPG